jgi:hypothetical protein
MSIVVVQGWHCAVCGYEWLKIGKPPLRCASRRCRSRKWNRDCCSAVRSQHAASCSCSGDPSVVNMMVEVVAN